MINQEQADKFKAILARYDLACETPSDINELLPYLRVVAEQCDHITEMGVRSPTSTWAFLAANPDRLISYDIARWEGVDEVEAKAPEGVFTFIKANVLDVVIEETDFLFIDTFHTASQLELELYLHGDKARKYIGFHDTNTFWETGEPPYEGIPSEVACGRGLKYAVEPFLFKNPEWRIDFQTAKNNGLTIIKRSE